MQAGQNGYVIDPVVTQAITASLLRMSEQTEGVRWRSRVALYQAIDYKRAMRYEVSMRGETDGTQPDLYGLRVTHRRSVLRDWLFIEFGGSLFYLAAEDVSRMSIASGEPLKLQLEIANLLNLLQVESLKNDRRKATQSCDINPMLLSVCHRINNLAGGCFNPASG